MRYIMILILCCMFMPSAAVAGDKTAEEKVESAITSAVIKAVGKWGGKTDGVYAITLSTPKGLAVITRYPNMVQLANKESAVASMANILLWTQNLWVYHNDGKTPVTMPAEMAERVWTRVANFCDIAQKNAESNGDKGLAHRWAQARWGANKAVAVVRFARKNGEDVISLARTVGQKGSKWAGLAAEAMGL